MIDVKNSPIKYGKNTVIKINIHNTVIYLKIEFIHGDYSFKVRRDISDSYQADRYNEHFEQPLTAAWNQAFGEAPEGKGFSKEDWNFVLSDIDDLQAFVDAIHHPETDSILNIPDDDDSIWKSGTKVNFKNGTTEYGGTVVEGGVYWELVLNINCPLVKLMWAEVFKVWKTDPNGALATHLHSYPDGKGYNSEYPRTYRVEALRIIYLRALRNLQDGAGLVSKAEYPLTPSECFKINELSREEALAELEMADFLDTKSSLDFIDESEADIDEDLGKELMKAVDPNMSDFKRGVKHIKQMGIHTRRNKDLGF
jgi:hypothetical protein